MSKPTELIGYILGYPGEGGLLAQLKAEGLATAIDTGSYDFARSFTSFELDVDLTPAGLEKYQRVLDLLFATIADLQQADYPSYLFHERQSMARLDEAYRDKGEGAERAVTLSTELWQYPLEVAERVPYLWIRENQDAYRDLLKQLRPDNMLVTLLARGVPTDKTEHYFGAKYGYVERAGPAYTSLVDPPPVTAIHLPKPNPYIPHGVTELPREPVHLIDEPALSLFYSQDTEFDRPMVAEIFRLRLPQSMGTLEDATRLKFYEACVNEALTETIANAGEAGLHIKLTADLEGVEMDVDGYNAAALRLLDTVIGSLVDFKLSDERFAAIKDRLVRPLEDFRLNEAYGIALETRRAVVREAYYRPDEMLPVAKKIALGDVRAFARQLYRQGRIEALVHGNVTADEAVAAARKLATSLKTKGVPPAKLIRRKFLQQPPGSAIVTVEQVAGSNSAFRREYVLGDDSPEIRAATVVLSNAIEDPVYTELRTKQQLGYIVGGAAIEELRSHMVLVMIQSGEHSADELMARAEPVVQGLPDLVRNMSDEEWATLVAGARSQLEEKDKTIAERAGRLFSLAYDYAGEWGRREATLAALDQLTRQRAADLLATALAPKTREMRTFLVFSRDQTPPAGLKPTFTDREAWKKTQVYQ